MLAPAEHLPLPVCTPKENEQTESWLWRSSRQTCWHNSALLVHEVAIFEKDTERPEDLGLSIAEGKALAPGR